MEEMDRARRAYRTRRNLYRDEGDGSPAVVFAHGTLMDRTMFDAQVEAVADAGYRAVAYDLRARTEYYGTEYDLEDLADDAVALLDSLGVDSCVYVGMSMGGFVALRLALLYPERVDGLVLIDSMAGTHTETQKKTYEAMLSTLAGKDEVPEPLAGTTAQVLFGDTTRDERPELVETWKRRWLSYPPEAVVNEVRSWLDRDDILPRAGEIDVPVLALHGEEDTSIPVERARETVDALPDARLSVVPDAGHSSNDENPAYTNRELLKFLRTRF